MAVQDGWRDAALRWIVADPDPATRAELTRVLDSGDAEELARRMSPPLTFGTAGIRGPVRAGPTGMNVAVVRRVTAGLAAWLVEHGSRGGLVVVGRDARHGSAAFAEAAASVFAAAGFEVRALSRPLPTPVLAYSVRTWGAVAGVQVTASHNPPGDNGYKVYLADGAQLVGPVDTEIEAHIKAAPDATDIPTVAVPETDPDALLDGYLDRVAALRAGDRSGLRIALTALHGVGNDVAVEALRLAGFDDVHVVAAQAAPDPDFPTVPFPNPEEPGATDALLELAGSVDADLAIALDPDADRCALGVRDPGAGWRMLTGNETGALLGDHLLATLDRERHPDPLVATTVASSTQLRAIASARDARFAETLTGFKWIVRAGEEPEGDPGFVYGFEEALGYCVDPGAVRDKDGISAAVLAADLATTRGPLPAVLDELAVAHGVYLTGAITLRMEPAQRAEAVRRLERELPGDRPAPDVFLLHRERARAVIRPSGTEPKLKAYLEVVEPVAAAAGLAAARSRASDRLARLRDEVEVLLGTTGES
ncbi:phospho-sugar mutase [Pseudonocardia spinosispora]|uniref:phospho-sugar mutase n=1 Tax=Pseudonocardia spinosispora TaxID=103441 RepID=UPI000423A37D|nr:phospho-sugar mutase [Pseudonocardia spinosispora]